ncbi:MAG: DUF2071 domain-containing protein [Bacteroidota bacterium]
MLKNHPFAVEAHFEYSLVFTFAVAKEELFPLIPSTLKLDIFEDRWAFFTVAMVQTNRLRPKGFPAFLGQDFFLIGYRIFVKFVNDKGKRLRGLYILKSETNAKQMKYLGNIFTHYAYESTDIRTMEESNQISIWSEKSKFELRVDTNAKEDSLPLQSPFQNWKQARRFAGPLPFTFTPLAAQNKMLIIEGVRRNWRPKAVEVKSYQFEFLNRFQFKNIRLANAFIIRDIPYFWKKGKLERTRNLA